MSSAAPTWLGAALGAPLVLGAAAAYLATAAPSVTWKNGGSDGAELATAAYVWGVAHPPGYPLYLTLVRLLQVLPVGDLAYRATLLSVLSTALAVGSVFLLCATLLRGAPLDPRWRFGGAAFGAAAFAFGPLPWSQATVPEVYALGAALFGLLLLASAHLLRAPSARAASATTAILALLASHQPTFAIAAAPLAWLVWQRRLQPRTWLPSVPLLLLGPLLLATLWLRATFQPPLNWGDPSSMERWLAHIMAVDYRSYFLARPLADELPRVPYGVALLIRQGGWLAAALAAFGLPWLWSERRPFALLALPLAAFFFVFAVLYNAQDSEVYLLPTYQVLAVAAGVGAALALHEARARWRSVVAIALVGSLAWQVLAGWPQVDLSRDTEARDWGVAALRDAPPAALIRSNRDETTFVLWFLQHGEGQRPDVAVVDDRLLALGWYREQVLRQYPRLRGHGVADSLASPAPTPFPTVLVGRR